jgi:hypothetical protein
MKHWKAWSVVILLAAIGIYFADFYFTRWIHYKMSYQAQVRSEIRSMVKSSCLQE